MSLLGHYPTRVTTLSAIAEAVLPPATTLLCKRDDETSDLYGGNKVRKLDRILEEAASVGATRLLTIGAVGSHHVLATLVFGRARGFAVEAILTPQPRSAHVEEIARIDAGLGLIVHPASHYARVPLDLMRFNRGEEVYFVPPGGSSVIGALGYVDAADELADQIERGDCPRPDAIVVALGSGGTIAGLLAGLGRRGLLASNGATKGIELVAAQVVDPPLTSAASALALTLAVWRRIGERSSPRALRMLSAALRVTREQLGEGYGHATMRGLEASRLAQLDGVCLDDTYTSKALATALDEAKRRGSGSTTLYWHTLAAPGPFQALLAHAPPLESLDPKVLALLRPATPEG